jgi:effector-binding domain-containing protein
MAMVTKPQVREIKPISFLFFRAEACLEQLPNFVPVANDLFKEAVTFNLQVTGPIHWHYHDFNGNGGEPFTLEIALPVAETLADYDGSFHFKRTDSFRCVTVTHEGSWSSMGETYEKLNDFITTKQLKPLAMTREVYVNSDFRHPEANLTEIQIGVE